MERARAKLGDLINAAHFLADTLEAAVGPRFYEKGPGGITYVARPDEIVEQVHKQLNWVVVQEAAERIRRFAETITPPTLPQDEPSLAGNYSGMIGGIEKDFHDAHNVLLKSNSPFAAKAEREWNAFASAADELDRIVCEFAGPQENPAAQKEFDDLVKAERQHGASQEPQAVKPTESSDASKEPRQPVEKILTADPAKEPMKWLWQLQEALEDIASDLGFIGSFDLAREQETLANPTSHVETHISALWLLWEGTVTKAVGLFGETQRVTDNIPQPLVGAKDCIEAATDILRDLGAKGQAMIDNWDDLAHPPTKLTEEELKAFPNNMLVVAEGFAEYVKRSQFPAKLQDVVCRLRGYAVRMQAAGKPKSAPAQTGVRQSITVNQSNTIELPKRSKPITTKELAEIFVTSSQTIRRRIKGHLLDAVPCGRKWRVLITELPAEYVQKAIQK